jgi:hypothetical protein
MSGCTIYKRHPPHTVVCGAPQAVEHSDTAQPTCSPLALVKALRADGASLSWRDINERLLGIEHSLQRSVSVAEAARIAGEKPATIYKAIARGNLTSRTEGASNVHRLAQADVEAWARRPRRASSEAA